MNSHANEKIKQLNKLKSDVINRCENLTRYERNIIVTAIDDVRDRFIRELPEENLLNFNE